MRLKVLLLLVLLFASIELLAQQVVDTLFDPLVANPIYPKGEGSVVLIDQAHHNFHTLTGRFKPFAQVLEKDGYQVKASASPFSREALAGGKILVIANALHATNQQQWSLPTPSAFTDGEISLLQEWVKGGGALLLIADHMPFPGAAQQLAAVFGIQFYNGFALKKRNKGKDIFTLKTGLQVCSLAQGRNPMEAVTCLQTFTGQAFQIPPTAHPVILLSEDYQLLLPQRAWQFSKDTPSQPATLLAQGAYFPYGQGRVVVFGEAAMFTAQREGKAKFGMNVPTAQQNVQFLLNTIHWLDNRFD